MINRYCLYKLTANKNALQKKFSQKTFRLIFITFITALF